MLLNILLALLVLNIMVIAHELGHYLLARKNGIGVHEFAIGFGPTLWKKKWNGTMWLIKAFPLGGYNGLKGEMEAESGTGNFSTARKWAKLQVLCLFHSNSSQLVRLFCLLGVPRTNIPLLPL